MSEQGRVEDNKGYSIPPTLHLPSLDHPPEHTKSFIHVLLFFFSPSHFFPTITLLLEIVSSTSPPVSQPSDRDCEELKRLAALSVLFAVFFFFFYFLFFFYIFFGLKKKNYISAKKAAGPIYKRLIYHYQINSEY